MSMAGGNNPKSSSSSHHKRRWESNASTAPATTTKSPSDSKPKPNPNNPNHNPNPNPSPKLPNDYAALIPFHFAEAGPPPPPIDGFHMLEQRIIHADGSVLSYFALLPDYQDFTPPPRPIGYLDTRFPPHLDGRHQDFRNQMEASAKRKFGDEDGRDEFARQREQLLRNANGFSRVPGGGEYSAGPSGPLKRDFTDPVEMRPSKHITVDGVDFVYNASCLPVNEDELEKAFTRFVELINENPSQKNSYLQNGKQGTLQCLACGSDRFESSTL